MRHNLKLKLRELSHKSETLSKVYRWASGVKTSHYSSMSDEEFLRRKFKENTGEELDLVNPKTFNMKLQWLKLHDHNPLYTTLVDKYAVKQYVADRIGEEHVIPVVGGPWESADEIDFDTLPENFVLKCNHDCGSVVICTDRSELDVAAVRKKLNRALNHNYYYVGREWPYKNVKPCIFAERYMVDESGVELKDYKFFCFGGEAKTIQVDYDRFCDHKRNLYSTTWDYLGYTSLYPTNPDYVVMKPKKQIQQNNIILLMIYLIQILFLF